jgi:hypothetical protein
LNEVQSPPLVHRPVVVDDHTMHAVAVWLATMPVHRMLLLEPHDDSGAQPAELPHIGPHVPDEAHE